MPPKVVVVVEGGYTTLLTAFKAIDAGTPVLVLAGSGRAADFIARAYEKHETAVNLAEEAASNTYVTGFLFHAYLLFK